MSAFLIKARVQVASDNDTVRRCTSHSAPKRRIALVREMA